jgi:hypothetical protein
LIVHVQALERATTADKAARLERCSLGGTNSQVTHAANAAAGHATLFVGNLHKLTFDDNSRGGKKGGGVDMSAEHRASTVTQQKFKDAGLDPATASKHALAGANDTGGGSN